MLTLTTALQGDALPQRQALYQLGNSLAAGEGGARDGFSHFRYIDQSQVLGYEGGGENIQVVGDSCSQAVFPLYPVVRRCGCGTWSRGRSRWWAGWGACWPWWATDRTPP